MEFFMLVIIIYFEKLVFSTHFEAQLKGEIQITTEIGQHMSSHFVLQFHLTDNKITIRKSDFSSKRFSLLYTC